MTAPNYNLIARYYDRLSRVVFGKRMELAKQAHLRLVKGKQKILIVGGGTGKLIEYIASIEGKVELDFVDASSKMLNRAKLREGRSGPINYYLSPILDYKGNGYDIITLNFFLDQFTDNEAETVLKHLKSKLVPGGLILFSDLKRTQDIRDRLLDKIMFFLFRLLTGAKTRDYPQYDSIFKPLGFCRTSWIAIGRNIEAAVYSTN